jgi:hypothetical protein
MKKTVLVLAVCITAVATPASRAAPKVVEFVEGQGKIDVLIGGKHFTSYLYGEALPKPVLVPVRKPSGIEVSRRHPLVELKGGSMDHLHHVGLFFAVDRVNGTNFWNYYRNPDGATPQIKHIKVLQTAGDNGRGKLVTVAHWIDKRGKFLLEEKRSMVFMAGERKDEWTLDFSLDLTAQKEKVVFEDIEEGVFAIRVSDYLRESDAQGGVRPGRAVPGESVSGTGRYFSSNGDETAKNVWGKRAWWVALQGVREGKVVGVAILNHPASINYPTYWHVRDYGLLSANPLGQGDFQRQRPRQYRKNKPIPLRLTLEPGEKAHFRFLVIVYEGTRTKEQMEERFKAFVK